MGRHGDEHVSICLHCEKGADECEWMRRLAPIKGWKARAVSYKTSVKGEGDYTYEVRKCPQYRAMPYSGESVCRKQANLSDTSDYLFASKKRSVYRKCVYGRESFCDGTPNLSEKGAKQRPPCRFFIGGQCQADGRW